MNAVQAIAAAPVRKTIIVQAPRDKAFDIFTRGMVRWWSKSHSINTSPIADIVVEPRAGGRWYERGEDGTECQWGHVIAWEPPGRVVFAWQINAEWKFDPSLVTEVEIRFIAEQGATRIELEHRDLEKFGDKEAAVRNAIDSPGGWQGLLESFAKVAEAA